MMKPGHRGSYSKSQSVHKRSNNNLAYGVCPPCTDQASFNNWHRLNGLSGREDNKDSDIGFCIDCNPKFQNANKIDGTCTRPEVVFIQGLDGCIRGWIDKKAPEKREKYKHSSRFDMKVRFVAENTESRK